MQGAMRFLSTMPAGRQALGMTGGGVRNDNLLVILNGTQ